MLLFRLIVDFMKEQTEIIRRYCPNHFITHNYMGFADKVNYYDLGKQLDFVSHDQYPGGFFADASHERGDMTASRSMWSGVLRSRISGLWSSSPEFRLGK